MTLSASGSVQTLTELIQTFEKPAPKPAGELPRKHGHYYRKCPYQVIDFYRIVDLYGVSDSSLQHVIKKALAAGKRGSKDFRRDLEDMRDSLNRRIEMLDEDEELGKEA